MHTAACGAHAVPHAHRHLAGTVVVLVVELEQSLLKRAGIREGKPYGSVLQQQPVRETRPMRKKLPLLFGAAFFALALGACEGAEGPAGPAGPQGEQGPAGPPGPAVNMCSDCHHSDATILAVELQVAESPHGEDFRFYENRSPCSACHSHNGFTLWADGSDIGPIPTSAEFAELEFWAPINCRTCHQIHESFTGVDFALTAIEDVDILLTGNTVDFTATSDEGVTLEGNLCASCHQARIGDPWPDGSAALTTMFDITSSRFGPHYGTQANVLAGELGQVEIPGTFPIASSPMDHMAERSCTGCHFRYDAETMELDSEHTFEPAVSVCQDCHATAINFNYRGIADEVETYLEEIAYCMVAVGVAEFADPAAPSWEDLEVVTGTHPEPYAAAWVNWEAFHADGSHGVHNPDYARTVLGNTLELLESQDATCATPPVVPAL